MNCSLYGKQKEVVNKTKIWENVTGFEEFVPDPCKFSVFVKKTHKAHSGYPFSVFDCIEGDMFFDKSFYLRNMIVESPKSSKFWI